MEYLFMAQEFYKAITGGESRQISKILDEGSKGMYCILRILRDVKGEILPVDIAKHMDISTARVAVAMKALLKKGYIEKIPTSYDGRKVIVKITPSGLQALAEREVTVLKLVETFLRKLTEEEAQTFVALAKKLFR